MSIETSTPDNTTTRDAYAIPTILIGLPNGSDVEVSFITHRCISIFEHSTGEITTARGDLALIAFLRQLLMPAPVTLRAASRVPACADRKDKNIKTQAQRIGEIRKLRTGEMEQYRGVTVLTYKRRGDWRCEFWTNGYQHVLSGYFSRQHVLSGYFSRQDALTAAYLSIDVVKDNQDALASDPPKTTPCSTRTASREHRIAVSQGEYSKELTVASAVAAYVRKYHTEPTLIKLSEGTGLLSHIADWNGIEIEFSASVLPGHIWVGQRS